MYVVEKGYFIHFLSSAALNDRDSGWCYHQFEANRDFGPNLKIYGTKISSKPQIACGLIFPHQSAANIFLNLLEIYSRRIYVVSSTGRFHSTCCCKHNFWSECFKGDTYEQYMSAVTNSQGDEDVTEDDNSAGLNAVANFIFPTNAALNEWSYLLGQARKPEGMLVREFFAEMKAHNRHLAFYPEVCKKQPDGTTEYELVEPLTDQLLLWSLERALPKSWKSKFIEHDISHILSTKEEFLSFCERIEVQEAMTGSLKGSKSNTRYSGKKKSGADIGRLSSTPQGEGGAKGNKKKKQPNANRGNCLLHGPNTHDTNECKVLGTQAKNMKATYAARDKSQDQQRKRAKYNQKSYAQAAYSGQKAEINAIDKEASKAAISSFVQKAKAAKKRKVEAELNSIDEELDNISLTGSNISAISGIEDPPADF